MADKSFDNIAVIKYRGLEEKGLVNNRVTLKNWIDRPPEKNPFPKPIHLSDNSVAWRVVDVEQWLDRQAKIAPKDPPRFRGKRNQEPEQK